MTDREAFEAWLKSTRPLASLDRVDDDYEQWPIHMAWLGWQAATAHAERRWLDAVARIESLQQELDKARATGDAERCPTPNDDWHIDRAVSAIVARHKEMLAKAKADASRQALEEAAQIARAHRSKICVNEPVWHDGADWACERIEEAIREKIERGHDEESD